jgi:hypothetical protein
MPALRTAAVDLIVAGIAQRQKSRRVRFQDSGNRRRRRYEWQCRADEDRDVLKYCARRIEQNKIARKTLVFGAARDADSFATAWRRDHGGHLANHGEDKLLVIVGQRGGIFFDVREEANLFFG